MAKNTVAPAVAEPGARGKAEKGSLRDDLRRYTSEKLLAAAMECFAEQGFRATTVERIVEVAGTTAPTFYRYYASKNDLLTPLRTHLTQTVMDTLATLDGEACRSREGVRGWVDTYLAMWGRVHRLCEAYWEATALNADYAAEALPQTLEAVGALSTFLQLTPEAERERISVRLTLMVLFLDRLAFLASVERSPARAAQIVDEFADMLWTTVFQPVTLAAPGQPAATKRTTTRARRTTT